MRFSVTERQLYKRCRRKWDYASYNRQSLAPVINAPALDLGTLIHATLAEWTSNQDLDPLDYYSTLSQKYFNDMIQLYIQRVGCAPDATELQPTQDAIVLGLGMISNYKDKWHTALPPGFTLIENELTLITDVPGTEHTECNDLSCCPHPLQRACPWTRHGCCKFMCHQLECTFDGVMQDANGDLYIIERKTFSRTPSKEELNNNDQFLAYMWALTQQMPNVVGVAYDGLLKRIKPVAGKTYDDLFLRRILLRNRHELAEFEQELALELNEMAANPKIYKTVPFMGCQRWECSFIDVCQSTSRGEPTEHLLKMFTRSDRKAHLDIQEAQ